MRLKVGLQMWVDVYEQVITALFFFEAIMIALLAIKRSFAAILVRHLHHCLRIHSLPGFLSFYKHHDVEKMAHSHFWKQNNLK